MCILVQHLYGTFLHQFSAVGQKIHFFGAIWCKFRKMYAGTASSIDAIWDEFSEQHKYQSIKISTISMPN